MISVYKLKPKFQALLMPVLKILARWGVTANQITLSSVILSFLIGLSFWHASSSFKILFLFLPFGLLIRMALNALDGQMARVYNQQSKKGEILNEVGDVISDVFIFFPLLLHESQNIYLISAFIFLSIINEFVGILGKATGGDRQYDGPMGKSDRALVIGVYGILSYISIDISPHASWVFGILILLILLSTFTRIRKSLS